MPKMIPVFSTESEYTGMAEAVKNVIFAQQILAFMRPSAQEEKVVMYEDNGRAIHRAHIPTIRPGRNTSTLVIP